MTFPFDERAITRLCQVGGTKLARQMISLFLENAPKRIESAQVASRIGDLETVERSVHSLKSSAGNVGAMSLQELVERIEQMAAEGKNDSISSLLKELERIFDRVKVQLEDKSRSLDE